MKFRPGTGCARLLLIAAVALPAPAIPQSTPAMPQPMSSARPEAVSAEKLELERDSSIEKGKGAVIKGTVDPEGLRYAVGGLSILQPVVVTLLARDEGEEVTLSLFKSGWEGSLRTGSTRSNGIAQFEFRTEGGVNILVRGSSASSPFALIVWAGDELRPQMNDVVVTRGATSGASGGRVGIAWILAAAAIGGAAVFLFLRLVGRRKKS